jgi:hypothetical protein
MKDQFEDWIEEYHEGSLPPARNQQMEEHLQACLNCRQRLELTRWSSQVTRWGAREAEVVVPSPWFAQKVLSQIAQKNPEVLTFWNPFIHLTQRAIPVMTILILILGFFAYREMTTILSSGSDDTALISYMEPAQSWGEEFYLAEASTVPATGTGIQNPTQKPVGGR